MELKEEVEEREEAESGKGEEEEEERREWRTARERSRRSAAATAQSCGPRPERRRALWEWERGSMARLEGRGARLRRCFPPSLSLPSPSWLGSFSRNCSKATRREPAARLQLCFLRV